MASETENKTKSTSENDSGLKSTTSEHLRLQQVDSFHTAKGRQKYKINRRPKDADSDSDAYQDDVKKPEIKITPHVEAVLDSLFPTKDVLFDSPEKAAAYQSACLHDDIDLIFTSYHAKTSDLKQVSGKKAVYEYWLNDYWKAFGPIGFTTVHHKVDIKEYEDGTVLFLAVEYIFIDKDKKKMDPMRGTNRLEIDLNGKITRFISYSQDFDIVSLVRKKYLLKNLDENDGNTVKITCLDNEFNKVTFELDKDGDDTKLKQIKQMIKEGEVKKKDVLIIVIAPKQKNGKSKSIVSHAIAV